MAEGCCWPCLLGPLERTLWELLSLLLGLKLEDSRVELSSQNRAAVAPDKGVVDADDDDDEGCDGEVEEEDPYNDSNKRSATKGGGRALVSKVVAAKTSTVWIFTMYRFLVAVGCPVAGTVAAAGAGEGTCRTVGTSGGGVGTA